MKLFLNIILALGMTACAGGPSVTGHRAADIDWPEDPSLRLVAEEWVQQMASGSDQTYPPGLDFAYRDIEGMTLSDNYVYSMQGLAKYRLRAKFIGDFYDAERRRVCDDPRSRFLIDNGFTYAFKLRSVGKRRLDTTEENFAKGFCVAAERPLVDQDAIDTRNKPIRYWPSGERIDTHSVVALARYFHAQQTNFEKVEKPGKRTQLDDIKAEGLMLTYKYSYALKKQYSGREINLLKAKGKALDSLCIQPKRLLAMTIGAVYSYSIDFAGENGVEATEGHTVSYLDCLLYNRK